MTKVASYLLVLSVMMAGCTEHSPDIGMIITVPAVHQLVVDDPELINSVDYAIAWWNEAGYQDLVRVDSCDPSQDCRHVRWAHPEETNTNEDVGGRTTDHLVVINPVMRGMSAHSVDIAMTHEMGHVRGLGHSLDENNIMNQAVHVIDCTLCIDDNCRQF